MQKLAYDLADLFERQPICPEGVIRFSDCFFDPETEPSMVAKLMSGRVPAEYVALVERVNTEIRDKEPKNYWK
jgi:hypothetical protein